MSAPDDVGRMIIRNRLDELPRVQERFAQFARDHAVDDRILISFRIALDEVVNNVITHGLPAEEERFVELEWELREGMVTVTVIDDGEEFDPLAREAPDTTIPLEQREIGGLGIHIVRTLMDEVRYLRRDGRNILTLGKRFLYDDGTG